MADKKVVEEKAVETETTQTSSPQVESPITGDETIQGEDNVQVPVVEEADVTESMTEEQRRAFQDQRLENKRLREELETKPKEDSAFNVFRAQTPPASFSPVRVENFIDPITGETNWQGYNQAQQDREQQIIQGARVEAQSTVQELIDEERARTKYPELMNDPVTEKQIASRWLYEKVQGNNVSISDIAGEFARWNSKSISSLARTDSSINRRGYSSFSDYSNDGRTAKSSRQSFKFYK